MGLKSNIIMNGMGYYANDTKLNNGFVEAKYKTFCKKSILDSSQF